MINKQLLILTLSNLGFYYQITNPTTVIAHGLRSNQQKSLRYHANNKHFNGFILDEPVVFDFHDVKNPRQSCIGQQADINLLHKKVAPHDECDLFGWSRGAATIANYAGTHQLDNVKSIILESPFDDTRSIIKHKTGFGFLTHLAFKILHPNHKPDGIQPIKSAPFVNRNIPILIYCSMQDQLIPASSSLQYYYALRQSGHNKVHILIVEHGSHANILRSRDGKTVRNVVHAFKKKYGRPYHAEWAKAGEERFALCQPEFPGQPTNWLEKAKNYLYQKYLDVCEKLKN